MSTSVKLIFLLVIFIVLLIFGLLLKGERFKMRQAATGKTVQVKRGFSFTYLFFGPFVPLFRGHIGGFFLTLLVTLCSCGTGHLILLFCYNGMYINWLVKHGYTREESLPVNMKITTSAVQAPPVDSQQAEQERLQEIIRRKQAREERNQKIAEVQESVKEKAQVVLPAAAACCETGKEKLIELSRTGKARFTELSKKAKEMFVELSGKAEKNLHDYLHEGEGALSDGGKKSDNKLKLSVRDRYVIGLGAFFAIMLIVSLFLDPRLRCQIHKWQYGMTQEQSEDYQRNIVQAQEENREFVKALDQKTEQKKKMEEEVKVYQAAYDKYNPDRVLKEALASVYQQSTASAIECKAIILESFGLDTGIDHYQEDDRTGSGQELREYVVDEAVGRLASGIAGDILKSGVNGGIDGWSEAGSLVGILEGLEGGVESGVAAAISAAPKQVASAFLGESLVNAVEAAASFQDLDTTSEHLLNTIAGEMKTSSEKFKPCLDGETMTKEELYQMIYWYYQYAKSASAMDNYSKGKSQTEIFGESYHTPLLKEYGTFVGSEALLRLLGTGGEDEKK